MTVRARQGRPSVSWCSPNGVKYPPRTYDNPTDGRKLGSIRELRVERKIETRDETRRGGGACGMRQMCVRPC